jgi:phosphomevalonate kinase
MRLVNNEGLKKLTNTTNGSINKQVVDFAKNILFSQLKSYISDEKQYKIINDKISNMKIELLSSPDFKDKYYESNGKGFLPAAFVYGGIIYFRNDINFDINDFHKLIHEMLHIISDNGEKEGLF